MISTVAMNESISIIGAGLAGSALSVLLSNHGFSNINVYEKRPRETDQTLPQNRARSINLALSDRGIKTLKAAGVIDEIEKIAIPMKGRMIHSIDSKTNFQPYSSNSDKHLLSVSRQLLNEKMRDYAERKSGDRIKFHYDVSCRDVNFRDNSFTLVNNETKESKRITTNTLVGSDGAFSAVRQAMTRQDRQEYSQSFLEHGYKELCIPAGPNGTFLLERECLHIWPRGAYMMIALPNIDGSFTCTLFFPFEGETNSFAALNSREKVDNFFKTIFPDAYAVMPTLLDDFDANPTSSLVTVKTYPWSVGSKAVLIGDAAHAIVPFYGQGMNAAFEDVLDLYQCIIEESKGSVEFSNEAFTAAYRRYQINRKKNSDAIAEMAVENFIEMRDKVADEMFVFKKKVEHLLEEKFQLRYISRYELISFSTTPYSEAQRIGLINQQILSELVKEANFDINKIDLTKADNLIKQLLGK
ncbi:kynurenine 3-monooxygenase [Heterostelium album PN500]|uniref:Kynurenine 3-monooxygenase n=1 Tax=Heterostelium pallidum (strain ATCC 26659 / Pp 5 / PN500) TaxID=670386 RepID=D3B5G1_HETP5|nr:kynurenine 3-monooxygenase [Heterostelium album PN500]EFA83109.1 kynurenine 3-monooxygenase [Heterostelium album PN500]|eukprot:XP_020435226.1 kynurenine 3-monooxygenase [Heterostelium album PN500]